MPKESVESGFRSIIARSSGGVLDSAGFASVSIARAVMHTCPFCAHQVPDAPELKYHILFECFEFDETENVV